jgi:hypothetical protein
MFLLNHHILLSLIHKDILLLNHHILLPLIHKDTLLLSLLIFLLSHITMGIIFLLIKLNNKALVSLNHMLLLNQCNKVILFLHNSLNIRKNEIFWTMVSMNIPKKQKENMK